MLHDAVLFDLDGTLTQSGVGILNCVRYAISALGKPPVADAVLNSFIGPPLYDSFVNVLGYDEDTAKRGVALYRERYREQGWRENAVYAGIPRLLRALKRQGVYLAVATGKPQPYTEMILEHFGLTRYFDRVCGVSLSAVDADKTALVRDALPERYTRAAMVGDRKFDMEGARANGIAAIGALYGYGTRDELGAYAPEFIAENVDQLYEFLLPGVAPARGAFITFEGLDGAGKTTLLDAVAHWLRARGHDPVITREPGGCGLSEALRTILQSPDQVPVGAHAEALLFAGARAQHMDELILPQLEAGRVVLCDRFVDSSIAYQGGGRRLGEVFVRAINAYAYERCLPDRTLLLDIDPERGLERKRGVKDRIERENLDFFRRVREGYLRIAREEPERVVTLDACAPTEAIAARACDALAPVL